MGKFFSFFSLFLLLVFINQVNAQSLSVVYPKYNQTVDTNFVLNWNSDDNADSYQILIYSDSGLANLVLNDNSFLNNKSATLLNGNYYWKVISFNGLSKVDSSVISRFNVFNPIQVDSIALWTRSDTATLLSSGFVSQWNDISGNQNHLTQISASKYAKLDSNVLNGYPALNFDNFNDRYEFPFGITNSNFTVSILYNYKGTTSGKRLVNGNSTNWIMGPFSGVHRVFNGGFVGGKAVIQDKFVAHTGFSKNDTIRNYVNGIFYGSRAGGSIPGNSISLSQNGLNGDVTELIVYDGIISEVEREGIDNYLMDRYAPPVNLGEDQLICSFPYSLDANKDYIVSYNWNTGSTDSVITINTSGKYYLTTTDVFERTHIDSIIITSDISNYQVDLIDDTTICFGSSINISAGAQLYNYQWNVVDTSNSIVVDSAFTYKVTVTNCLGNPSIDSVTIAVNHPEFSLGNDTTICFYDSLEISPDTLFQVNYSWSNGSVDSIITINASSNYTLSVTDNFGCQFIDSIDVIVDSILFGIDLGPDTALCSGNHIGLLNPIAGIDSYQWSISSMDSFIVVNTSQKYYLTVSENSCQANDSVDISIKGIAPVSGFTTLNNCFGDSIHFTDTSFDVNSVSINKWKWYFGDGDSSLIQNPVHYYDTAGTYQVQLFVENDSSCVGVKNETFTLDPKPEASFVTSTLCENDTIVFTDSSTITSGIIQQYFWDFGELALLDDTSIVKNPSYKYSATGTYAINQIIRSDKGCLDALIDSVKINASPVASFGFSRTFIGDTTYFTNQSTINIGNISTYFWDFSNGSSDSIQNPKVLFQNKGKYGVSLTATSDSSCINTFIDTVIISDPPADFNLVFPKHNQTLDTNVKLLWNKHELRPNYVVEIYNDSLLTNLAYTNSTLAIEDELILLIGSYYWRVLAQDDSGIIDSTAISRFNVFNPQKLDSILLWVRSDTSTVLANGFVSQWNDISGKQNNLTQALSK